MLLSEWIFMSADETKVAKPENDVNVYKRNISRNEYLERRVWMFLLFIFEPSPKNTKIFKKILIKKT
jgi:hypothetical protein